jgi:hypothetical protein
MAIYFLILAIVSIIVIIVSTKTCLLRDIVIHNAAFHANASEKKIEAPKAPFSLARTQLAFWTVIIFSSFVYLLFKHDFSIPYLHHVNLILLGIALGTTVTGKIIDDSQKANLPNLSQDHPSEGFLIDILSDKNGVSIHRLQNVLWTLIVGVIYIQCVAAQSSLPDETVLTDNLLMLMGISTTAYVGLKTMENSKGPENAGNPVNPGDPANPVKSE